MNNEKVTYIIGGIFIGGAVIWLLIMTATNSNNTGMMQMMGIRSSSEQGTNQNSSPIDQHFIEQMIPHHEDAITMAKSAQVNAKRPEVKKLAENIIDSQSSEITQMKDWYMSWFGKSVPDGSQVMNQHGMRVESNSTHMGMMGDTSDMTSLENADDFDRAFVQGMIPHHQMAVMMANMLKGGTQRPEMKKLADDIVSAQTDEIELMRQWLKEWEN